MFIMSKKNFRIRRADGSSFSIKKDFIGEIPNDVASHWLVQAAIASGSIATPAETKDRALEQASEQAQEKADEADIRKDSVEEKSARESGENKDEKQSRKK